MRQLQALGILDKNIIFGTFSHANHDRRWGRQAEGTRASDDKDSDRCQQRMGEGIVSANDHPSKKGQNGNTHHYGNKDSGNFVHQFLYRRFTALRLLYQFYYLRENGIAANFTRLKLKAAFLVDCSRKNGIS